MASCLPSFDALLVGSCSGVEDKDCSVCLTGALNHVRDEVTVTWTVEHSDVFVLCLKVSFRNINCDSVLPFFFVLIHEESKLKNPFVKNDRATKAWYTWQERTGRTCIEGDFVAGNVAIIEKVKDEAA